MAVGCRGAVEPRETNPPGLIRDSSHDLGIEEVAQANQRGAQSGGEREPVGPFQEGDAAAPGEHPHRDDEPDDRSVAGESPGPDLQDPQGIFLGLGQVIKQHVSQAGADQDGQDAVDEEVTRVALLTATAHDLPAEQLISAQKDRHEDEAVVPELVGSDVE